MWRIKICSSLCCSGIAPGAGCLYVSPRAKWQLTPSAAPLGIFDGEGFVTAEFRERYRKALKLLRVQPWLGSFEAELDALLDECNSDSEADLIFSLLHRFCYLSSTDERGILEAIASEIIGLGFAESDVQVVALAANDDPDSSQAVIYSLKPIFARRGWQPHRLVNRFSKAQQYVQQSRKIVLVDEFVGTGRTLVGRIEAMKRDFRANKKVVDAEFYSFSYAGMESAYDLLSRHEAVKKVWFSKALKRGISDFEVDLGASSDLMLEIESRLSPRCGAFDLPNFGDGKCEALYGREGGNCPNSVFPVFWWPESASGLRRDTILTRAM